MKPTKPTLKRDEVAELDPPTAHLLGIGVRLSPDGKIVVLSVEYQSTMTVQPATLHVAMAPPSAAELARMLRKAVKTYLRQADDNADTQ